MNNAPVRFTRSFNMRADDEYFDKLNDLRRFEPKGPIPQSEMVRLLVDRAHAELPPRARTRRKRSRRSLEHQA